MKKLILIAILFASCNPSKNIKEIDGETKLPNSVVIALNDTTGFDKKLFKTDEKTYVLSKVDKKVIVEKEIENLNYGAGTSLFLFVIGIITGGLFIILLKD